MIIFNFLSPKSRIKSNQQFFNKDILKHLNLINTLIMQHRIDIVRFINRMIKKKFFEK